MKLLNNKFTCLVATGYSVPFRRQPLHIRENILRCWSTSYITPLRDAFFSLSFLLINIWIKSSLKLYPAIGFPSVPKQKHVTPAEGYEFIFEQFRNDSVLAELETDVLIIGSGCGGAVAAAKLAEAGQRVMVVDKGYYHKPEQFPMSERDSSIHMFERGQFVPSHDGSISVAAGSTWGGGGTVNWSASLQTQAYVRKEWSKQGLKFFESSKFQDCLDRVCVRMGVSADQIVHNHGNAILLEGARRLGYRAYAVPQNTGGKRHFDGFCSHGCASTEKLGPANAWLPDAAKCGARFVEGFQVDKILFEHNAGEKVALGVEGIWVSRDDRGTFDGPNRHSCTLRIRAKRIVLSAGTLWSPVLLLNSGIKNPNIGRNFYAHPVVFTSGIFEEEVNPWEGGILTSVCSEFENLDGNGHGVKIEATCMTPSMSLSFYPWISGAHMKRNFLRYKYMNHYIAIARDRDPGNIYSDPVTGEPRVTYSPSVFDRSHLLIGQIATARMLFATGAREIHVMTAGVPPFIRRSVPGNSQAVNNTQGHGSISTETKDDLEMQEFEDWISLVQRTGLPSPHTTFGNAHQMGTCRMGTNRNSSVVDPTGKVWGVKNLWACDASVFPSASGVNPMVTVMAIADWISGNICKDIEADGPRISAML
ncbi:putative long-chain-alcohol oxidase FAO2 [Bisporella sp. PMI_857]|nr:putative long-chain-alcohol oxidase FAO2 [Bisporella sp. PMI_857]